MNPTTSQGGGEVLHACVGSEQRCCSRKPLTYKREQKWFCARCCRAYRMPTGEQIQNWAWLAASTGFQPKYPAQDYTLSPGAPVE
jgi:hypothetical protein